MFETLACQGIVVGRKVSVSDSHPARQAATKVERRPEAWSVNVSWRNDMAPRLLSPRDQDRLLQLILFLMDSSCGYKIRRIAQITRQNRGSALKLS